LTRIDPHRRAFLKRLGIALGGGLAASSCREEEDPFALEKPKVPGEGEFLRGEERRIATSCAQCPASCGIRVRVVEGRAVKIEGNSACPINRGGVGPRGLSGPQVLYDPDRIPGPMRRRLPRGEAAIRLEDWERVGWDEALSEVGGGLREMRAAGEPHRLVLVCGRERGSMLELFRRFAAAFGTPNLLDGSGTGEASAARACSLMQGVSDVPAYDWTKARYVLSLGSSVLEASCQLVHFARAQGKIRRGTSGVRAKIVHVGPAYSRTAMNADEWVPARTGTYGALALSLAHVLVRDGLHDTAFVHEHCSGFEPWDGPDGRHHRGFREILEEYAPSRVASITGVEEQVIERLAKELASARPSFAFGGSDEYLAANGLQAAMAVHALNALLGAIDRPGGLLVQRDPPLKDWPELEQDEIASAGLARPALCEPAGMSFEWERAALDHLPLAILAAEAPPRALFLYYSNPLYARAEHDRWKRAMARVESVVSFSPFLDESTAEFADWVLPDLTYLERYEDASPAPSVGHPVFALRQPVVEPLCEGLSTGDALIRLAAEIGEPVAQGLPFKDHWDAVKKRVIGLHETKRGSIVEEKGAAFLKRLGEEGFWADETYEHERWDEVLRTPSGRFEFFSTTLWGALERRASARGLTPEAYLEEGGVADNPDRMCMPRHLDIPMRGDPERFPFLLLPYRPSTYAEGSGANLPWLQELHMHVGRPTWTTEVELHPDTAEEAGIVSGDRVEIASSVGRIEALAHVSPGVVRGFVRIAQGGGHTALGRFARGWGANVMDLVAISEKDTYLGVSPLQGTRVDVRRIGNS
jgi:anaerobic selenocysteine-containing dehydrogenase